MKKKKTGIEIYQLNIIILEGKMDKKITNYLNAVYQNSKTALESIDGVLTKIECKDLRDEILNLEKRYEEIAEECEEFARKNGIGEIKDNNWFEKARLWTSINVSTLTDKSNRKIAEMMLLGTFMGIITCIKDEYDHKGLSPEIDAIITKLKDVERESITSLIPYLEK